MKKTGDTVHLKGYSGLNILLMQDQKGHFIVKKKANKIEQNYKVQVQYQKHLFFSKLKRSNILVPEVLGAGLDDKLFYYNYRYIEGITFVEFIQTFPLSSITEVLDKIIKLLCEFKNRRKSFEGRNGLSIVKALNEKIIDNCLKCQIRFHLKDNLLKMSSKIKNHNQVTLCHGDFSFDNLIIDKNQNIWLIDFSELFYPHYWFDISKMFQDIDGGWSEINHRIKLPEIKLKYIRNYLMKELAKLDQQYLEHHQFLIALVFLRLLPYAKNDLDRKNILNKIELFLS